MKQKSCQKVAKKYSCKKCDYECSNKYNFNKHLSTTKHKMKQMKHEKLPKSRQSIYACKTCNQNFKSRTTLWRHTKESCVGMIKNSELSELSKLSKFVESSELSSKSTQNLPESYELEKFQNNDPLINTLLKIVEVQTKNQVITNELVKQNTEIMEKIANTVNTVNTTNALNISNNITNNNCNNKMTINMYLNKECKDALNLTDFINKVHVSLEDLKYTTEYGYVKGISNIFAKQLQYMKPTERPIHCSDKKRMQFYIKDEDKWEKDVKHSAIDKSIADVTLKQIKKIRHWEDVHPNFMRDEGLRNIWNTMMITTMGGSADDEMDKNKMNIKKEMSTIIEVKDELNKLMNK